MDESSWADPPRPGAFPIAKPGFALIGIGAFITLISALLQMKGLALIGLGITLFICWFFRDPDRAIPNDKGVVVSPADGKVIFAQPVEDDRFYGGQCLKISIFMNIFNVHVNRFPHEGTVQELRYFPGKFFSANLDKAVDKNEHNALLIESPNARRYWVVQIAGLVARRIRCWTRAGEPSVRGERFGMICFGSRLDLYLPPETELAVKPGDKVSAGASVVGYMR